MQNQALGASGLFTGPSSPTSAPLNASTVDTNVVIDVPGERTTRKGFERIAAGLPGGAAVEAWTWFQGQIVAHSGTSLLRFDGTSWTAYSGDYHVPTAGTDNDGNNIYGRVKFVETQQTLYITTGDGVYRLEDVTGTPELAGVAPAFPGTVALSGTEGQALAEGNAVAYRYVWGRRAENGRIMLGSPSDRVVVENTPTASELEVSSIVRASDTVTVTTTTAHGYSAGALVRISVAEVDVVDFPPGDKVVDATPTTTTFTYLEAGPDDFVADLANASAQEVPPTQDVAHVVPIPPEADDSYFLQAYRSDEADADVGPSDELYLVYERAFADLPTGSSTISFTDATPDALKAAALYTNVNSGEGGIGAAHRSPPLATLQTIFKDRAFFGNLRFNERVSLTVLAAGDDGMQPGFALTFRGENGWSETYLADTSESFPDVFKVYDDGTPTQNVARTVASLVAAINSRTSGHLYAHMDDSAGTIPGVFSVESRIPAEVRVTVRTSVSAPFITPALKATIIVASMTRSADVTTVALDTGVEHGFVVGQEVARTYFGGMGDMNFPAGTFTVASVVDPSTFTISDPGADAFGPDVQAYFETTGEDVTTDDEWSPGGWTYSDIDNPDSVPSTLPERAGDRYKRLLRFLPLGDSLFMLKEDGLFRLTGSDPTSFQVEHVDSTVTFVAPEVAFTIGGTAYALTTAGLVQWTESSKPAPADIPINAELRALVETAREAVELYGFAISHDSKHRAYLFLPSIANDTSANQVYVLSTLNGAWTKWAKSATTAMVVPGQDRLYLAPPEVDGVAPAPARERNTGTSADYADESGEAIQAVITWVPNWGTNPSSGRQFVYVTYHFAGQVPDEVEVAFATDWTPTQQWFPIEGSWSTQPGTLKTPLTLQHQRGHSLAVSIRHAEVGVPLRMLGYTLQFREYLVR